MTSTPSDAGGSGAAGAVSRCHAVLVHFLAAIDHGHATQALALFSSDASLDARGEQLHGHEQIAAFLAERESEDRYTAHLIANEVVRRHTGDEVETTALLFLHERQADSSRCSTPPKPSGAPTTAGASHGGAPPNYTR